MKQITLLLVLMTLLVACQVGDGITPTQESETADSAEDAAVGAQEIKAAPEEDSPEEEVLEYDTFVSEEWGFRIDYPRGWKVEVSDQLETNRKWVFFETDNWNGERSGVVGYRIFVRILENDDLEDSVQELESLINGQRASIETICEPEQFVYANVELNESEYVNVEYIGPNVSDWQRIVGSLKVLEKSEGDTFFSTVNRMSSVCDEDDRKFQ